MEEWEGGVKRIRMQSANTEKGLETITDEEWYKQVGERSTIDAVRVIDMHN